MRIKNHKIDRQSPAWETADMLLFYCIDEVKSPPYIRALLSVIFMDDQSLSYTANEPLSILKSAALDIENRLIAVDSICILYPDSANRILDSQRSAIIKLKHTTVC